MKVLLTFPSLQLRQIRKRYGFSSIMEVAFQMFHIIPACLVHFVVLFILFCSIFLSTISVFYSFPPAIRHSNSFKNSISSISTQMTREQLLLYVTILSVVVYLKCILLQVWMDFNFNELIWMYGFCDFKYLTT
jgi:hypothetical protein